MDDKFEDKYLDVLQNIEASLVPVYREHPEMTDWEAHEAVNGLIRAYKAETRGRAAPLLRLNPVVQEAYERVGATCEWRMGRESMLKEKGDEANVPMTPKTVDEMIACLQRILRSIEMWEKEGGRRGYFNFVSRFVK